MRERYNIVFSEWHRWCRSDKKYAPDYFYNNIGLDYNLDISRYFTILWFTYLTQVWQYDNMLETDIFNILQIWSDIHLNLSQSLGGPVKVPRSHISSVRLQVELTRSDCSRSMSDRPVHSQPVKQQHQDSRGIFSFFLFSFYIFLISRWNSRQLTLMRWWR